MKSFKIKKAVLFIFLLLLSVPVESVFAVTIPGVPDYCLKADGSLNTTNSTRVDRNAECFMLKSKVDEYYKANPRTQAGGGAGREPVPGGTGGGAGQEPAPTGGTDLSFELKNPLEFKSLQDFIVAILNIVIVIATPIVVIFIILAGFKYVTARGNATSIQEATRALTYAIIGGVLIIGAVAIAEIIKGLITSFS
jgi:hypothetical protein